MFCISAAHQCATRPRMKQCFSSTSGWRGRKGKISCCPIVCNALGKSENHGTVGLHGQTLSCSAWSEVEPASWSTAAPGQRLSQLHGQLQRLARGWVSSMVSCSAWPEVEPAPWSAAAPGQRLSQLHGQLQRLARGWASSMVNCRAWPEIVSVPWSTAGPGQRLSQLHGQLQRLARGWVSAMVSSHPLPDQDDYFCPTESNGWRKWRSGPKIKAESRLKNCRM